MQLRSRKKIALDTNMLIAITQFRIDVFSMLQEKFGRVGFVVPNAVLQELEKLAGKSRRMHRAAGIAKKLLKKNNARIVLAKQQNADAALKQLAKKGYAVATLDRALRKTIKGFGGKNIYLRKKRLLVED